jgi:hypothetical protein
VLTAVSPGTTEVVATMGTLVGKARVEVQAPPVTFVSFQIVGRDTTMVTGTWRKFVATKKFSNDSVQVVSATWTSSNYEATENVDPDGTVHAMRPGVAQITASFEGRTSTIVVTVVEMKWENAPALSPPTKAYAIANMVDSVRVVGFARGPKTVFVGAGINATHAMAAAKHWWTNDSISFTTDSLGANVVFTTNATMQCPAIDPNGCGGPVDSQRNVLTKGLAYIRPDKTDDPRVYFHEMGHVTGVMIHTQETGPLGPPGSLSDGPMLAEYRAWLAKIPPGTYIK